MYEKRGPSRSSGANHLDLAFEAHQQQLDLDRAVLRLDLIAKQAQLRRVNGRFFRAIPGQVLAQDQRAGPAIPVIDDDRFVNAVKLDRRVPY